MAKKNGNILIVDDNRGVLTALQLLLKPYFEGIITLPSPVTLPSVLRERSWQVVLLDMNFTSGINTGNEEEAMKVANLIGSLLNMKVAPGNSSIFVGNKEFEIMKKPGRGTNGHIAIGCNNVDRAIYHLSQRGVKFDLDSKNVKNGKTVACYMADEIAGFAFHLVQA